MEPGNGLGKLVTLEVAVDPFEMGFALGVIRKLIVKVGTEYVKDEFGSISGFVDPFRLVFKFG